MILTSFILGANLLLQNAAFQLSIPGLAKAPVANEVLAVVNGVEIKGKDVEDLLWETHGNQILTEVMYYQVAISEGKKKGVIATQEEVDKGVAAAIESYKANLSPGQNVDQALEMSGQTRSLLAIRIKAQLIMQKLALVDFNAKDFVKVSTIIVRPTSNSATDVASAIQVVQKAYDRIKKGEPWEKLVDELTVDSNSRQSRGLLGWRSLSLFPKEAQDELSGLMKGGITKPVQTNFGIQIFRLEAKGESVTGAELDQLKQEVSEFLMQESSAKIRASIKVERKYKPKSKGS